jgi:multisubunit Na+/H+ antiporter MnhB subunit
MRIRESLVLTAGVRTIAPTLILFSLFALVIGHDRPGGGFIGGLIAGSALVLVFLSGGSDALRRTVRVPPTVLAGLGLAVAMVVAVAPMFIGDPLLTSLEWKTTLPAFGDVKISSVLGFDTGVYLVVLGLVGTTLERLGQQEDEA